MEDNKNLYRNKFEDRECGKESPQNFPESISQGQGASSDCSAISSLKAMVVGDTYLDLISEQKGTSVGHSDTFLKTFGGDGFLTAVALRRLGALASLTSLIGNDAFGKNIIAFLEKEQVSLNLISSFKTPLRFLSSEQLMTDHIVYQEKVEALLPFQQTEQSMTIYFMSYLLKHNLLQETKAQMHELKNKGEALVLVLEESINQDSLLELADFADLIFSFGIKSPAFMSTLSSVLKKNKASFVIEREEGLFEALHHAENDSFFIESSPAEIPSFVASYCANWFLKKPLAETTDYLVGGVSLSLQNAITTDRKSTIEAQLINKTQMVKNFECLCFLTFDQTAHFDDLARAHMRSREEISAFKELIYKAFLRTLALEHTATLGVCVDNLHGKEILTQSNSHPFSVIRTIDSETKKAFMDHPYSLVRSFPRSEIIKVWFNLKDGEMPGEDLRFLKTFSEAVLETGHRLLVEIYDKEIPGREGRVLPTLKKIYKQGIRPALWKLQPSFDLKGWGHFEETIDQYDPTAGILILGDKLSIKDLAFQLKTLKEKTHKIKGFAIGRSIWQTISEHWFEKRISDEMVECEVAFNFKRLLRIWENPAEYHEEEFEAKTLEHLKR